MDNASSAEALDQAEQALRKLSRDLATYRDPVVRRHLQSISPGFASSARLSDDPAQLKALIIAMRTEVHESSEARDRVITEFNDAKKRAAKSEAEVEELKSLMNEKDVEHDEIVKRAAERMQTLEDDQMHATQSASDKAMLLNQTIEKDRLGNAGLIAERNTFQAQAKELRTEVSTLQRELRAGEEKRNVEERAFKRELETAQLSISSLEEELSYLRTSQNDDKPEQLQSSRRQSVDLQREAATVRIELAEQMKKSVALREKLTESQHSMQTLKRQLSVSSKDSAEAKALRGEVEKLRLHKKESENIRLQLSALLSEKETLTSLIAALSPTREVEEGLKILKSSSSNGITVNIKATQDQDTSTNNEQLQALEKRNQLESEAWEAEIRKLKQEHKLNLGRLNEVISERDEARLSSKKSERVRRILQHERNCFKAALEGIDADIDSASSSDAETASLRKRCDAFEKSAKEYEMALKEVENSLVESQGRVRILSIEVDNFKDTQSLSGSAEVEKLKANLSKAMQFARDVTEAKRIADENNKEVRNQLSSVQDELEHLKLAGESLTSKPVEEELDYDPAVTKVLHMKNNLLSQAIEAHAIELEKAKGKKRMRIEVHEELVPMSDEVTDQKMSQLKAQIQDLEDANAKLIRSSKVGVRTGELAKKKIEEVRGAVYNIFGWSMKLIGAKYIISSIYGESPNDILEFGVNEAGTMALLETGYTTRLSEEIEQFVQRRNSIPALLANITMENYEKSTFM